MLEFKERKQILFGVYSVSDEWLYFYWSQKFFWIDIFAEIFRHFLCLIANSENYTD